MNLRHLPGAAAALALAVPLCGCGPGAPQADTSQAAPSVPSAAMDPDERASAAPDRVLQDWAHAIERRDWAKVRALWGNQGADSGLAPAEFAVRWDRLRHPRVIVEPGREEGAAGSLYYTAPITITDGAHKFAGEVTLRRVNDVPGASAEQLRWHFDAATGAAWAERLSHPGKW